VTATVAGLWRGGEQAFNGVVQILNTIPLLALLPIMIVWFGIGEESKVLQVRHARPGRLRAEARQRVLRDRADRQERQRQPDRRQPTAD